MQEREIEIVDTDVHKLYTAGKGRVPFWGGECKVGGGERELWCKMAVPSVSISLEKITEKMGKNKIEVVERIASYVSQHSFDIREGFTQLLL